MESRAFIKSAAQFIRKMDDFKVASIINFDIEEKNNLQKELHQLFAGLQNPTLPSAYKLRDHALKHGFEVDQRVQHRLSQFEYLSA